MKMKHIIALIGRSFKDDNMIVILIFFLGVGERVIKEDKLKW